MLTEKEAELIASLPNDPAYMLLIEKLQAGVDDITERLYSTQTQREVNELFPYWKAFKTVVTELKFSPVEAMHYVDSMTADIKGLRTDMVAKNQLDTFVNNFNKMRQSYTEEMSENYNKFQTNFEEPKSPGNWL